MKIRIRFAKFGCMKFIGHLDVMRFFQKVMRRADVDICYTTGFSPHQIMSFSAPLGLGVTSEAEYVDIEVNSTDCSKEMVRRLNEAMVEGMQVLSYRLLPDKAKNAMSIVAASDYHLSFRDGYAPEQEKEFWKKLDIFLKKDSIMIKKKTKKNKKEVDIRPLIYDYKIEGSEIFLKTATGSVQNLKPELVIEAFYEYSQIEWNPFAIQVHRLETYSEKEDGSLISLEDLGEEIE
ncbi:MAG: TIGR03936 family radical SAM-associated protein [Clostridiales bacterium]|nr:TIGR03936 family radical SAM-associated protein [Clostridiales bacterium]